MSVGPLNEVLVIITNVFRRYERGQILFGPTTEGEERFDQWQSMVLTTARIIHDNWNATNNLTEDGLDVFERLFESVLPSATKETM